MVYERDLRRIKIVCFDLAQYNIQTQFLYVNVWANYQGDTVFSNDIIVSTYRLKWYKNRWQIPKKDPEILKKGIDMILDYLNYEKNLDFFDEI